jgi:hypothetical protein
MAGTVQMARSILFGAADSFSQILDKLALAFLPGSSKF